MPSLTPTAIVTGAASGIGRAIALALAKSGYAIALVGRTAATLEQAATEIHKLGATALAIPADVSNSDQVDRMIRHAHEKLGRIDVLVNAAGVAPMIPTPDITPAQWHEIIDTNLSSVFYTTRAVWPILRNQHIQFVADHRTRSGDAPIPRNVTTGGCIINISSMAARDPFPGLGAYAVAKSGVNMLTQVTAREGEPFGIRTFAIAPAGVETPMFRELLTPDQVPSDQILRPEDVASLALDFIQGSLRHSSGETLYLQRHIN